MIVGECPLCGKSVKDKGSYFRCTDCTGVWDTASAVTRANLVAQQAAPANTPTLRERENDHDVAPETIAAEPESSVKPGRVAAPAKSCLVKRLRLEAMMWEEDSEWDDYHEVFTATIDLIEKLEGELRSQEAELRAARWQLKTKQNIIDRLIDQGRNPNS